MRPRLHRAHIRFSQPIAREQRLEPREHEADVAADTESRRVCGVVPFAIVCADSLIDILLGHPSQGARVVARDGDRVLIDCGAREGEV